MKLNKDVLTTKMHKANKWTKAPSKTAKSSKQIRMSVLAANMGDTYLDEFSAQKQNVVDEIVYKTVETGVYVAHLDTLKSNVVKVKTGDRGVSATTVKETVRLLRLHATKEFYIGQIGNGNAGAYVFADLRHPNASKFMADLFGIAVCVTGVDNTNGSLDVSLNGSHGVSLENAENESKVNESKVENADVPVPSAVAAEVVEDENVVENESLSFISSSSSFKDLKPKQEAPVNLYGKVCKLLKVVGRNSLVTKLVRLAEKAKKDIINFTDDHFMYALNESVNYNANDLEAYTASIIYNTASTRKENVEEHAVPVSLQKQDNRPQSQKEAVQAQIEALEQKNKEYAQLHATQAPNEWFYPKKIEQNNKDIEKLKAKLSTMSSKEQPVRDFEAEKKALLKQLGLA